MKKSFRHTQQTADFCPLKSRKENFLEAAPPNLQKNVRCKVNGQNNGTKLGADSLSKVERFSKISYPAVPSFREKMSVVK